MERLFDSLVMFGILAEASSVCQHHGAERRRVVFGRGQTAFHPGPIPRLHSSLPAGDWRAGIRRTVAALAHPVLHDRWTIQQRADGPDHQLATLSFEPPAPAGWAGRLFSQRSERE